MGPAPACRDVGRRQGKAHRSFTSRSRPRVCLLKGCGGSFVPSCWSQKYCSRSCRAAADVWRRRKAAREYRHSDKGKAKRAAQSRRRRERQGQEKGGEEVSEGDSVVESTQPATSEGHHPFVGTGDFCCDRPGCYVLFDRAPRSPLQRFCTSSCCRAMRRVRAREALWRVRALLRRLVGCSRGREARERRCLL
jgi:hypothetical protein